VKMHAPILTLVEKAAQDGLKEAAKQTLKRARDLSPTLTGESDKSGFVAVDDLTVQVGFTSPVSVWQHENLDYQHPRGGTAKFLEGAAAQVDVTAIIAAAARQVLGG